MRVKTGIVGFPGDLTDGVTDVDVRGCRLHVDGDPNEGTNET